MTTTTITAEALAEQVTVAAEYAVAGDNVEFYSRSGRHMGVLEEGTERREHAEWIMAQRGEGKTMNEICAESGWSKPKVRRMINELLLTWEVEEAVVAA